MEKCFSRAWFSAEFPRMLAHCDLGADPLAINSDHQRTTHDPALSTVH